MMRHLGRFLLALVLALAIPSYAPADGGGKGGSGSGDKKDGGDGGSRTGTQTGTQTTGGGSDDGKKGDDAKKADDAKKNENENERQNERENENQQPPANNNAPNNNNAPAETRTRVLLASTAAGDVINAEGHADLRTRGASRRLQVEIEVNANAGTTFQVFVNGTQIGTITIDALGEGEIEIDNGTSLPDPVTSVQVKNGGGMVILQGSF